VYIIWGSTYLAIRVAIETLPGLLMAGVRFLVAGSIMFAIGIARGDREGDRPTKRQWWAAAVIGTALCLGGNGLVVLAEERIASGTAALIVAAVPMWVAVFEWARHGVRLARAVVIALLTGFAGVGILVGPGDGGVDTIGALLVVGATVSWAAGSVYARRADLPKRPVVSTGMEMIGGGIALLVAGTLSGEWGTVDAGEFSRSSLLAMAYLTVLGSIAGFSAYVWLLRNVEASLATTYAYVNPFVAVLLGALIVDEEITRVTLIAGAIIIGSVAVIVRTLRLSSGEESDQGRADLASEEIVA